jgi:hypothetical protein
VLPAEPGSMLVSIYESGSGDRTPSYLKALDYLLAACGVPTNVTVKGNLSRAPGEDRIAFLAKVRKCLDTTLDCTYIYF